MRVTNVKLEATTNLELTEEEVRIINHIFSFNFVPNFYDKFSHIYDKAKLELVVRSLKHGTDKALIVINGSREGVKEAVKKTNLPQEEINDN